MISLILYSCQFLCTAKYLYLSTPNNQLSESRNAFIRKIKNHVKFLITTYEGITVSTRYL